jgi:hypothetical protein
MKNVETSWSNPKMSATLTLPTMSVLMKPVAQLLQIT